MVTRRGRAGVGEEIATFIKDTVGRGNWGHRGLATLLKDVGTEEAVWSPGGDTHPIWEEVNHIVYWSQFARDVLKGPVQPVKQAWPAPDGSADGWRDAVARVSRLHAMLVRQIRETDQKFLMEKVGRGRRTIAQLLLGCAGHIAYHTGQIALLKKLFRTARRPNT